MAQTVYRNFYEVERMQKLIMILLLMFPSIGLRGTIGSLESQKWSNFIESLHKQENMPSPFSSVTKLITEYLPTSDSKNPILDVGCETGKHTIPLIEAGHKVVILDIAPNAIQYTLENARKRHLEKAIVGAILGKIEDLDRSYGPFKAVTGSYVFSFIPQGIFLDVMQSNVLERIEIGGYFAGGFFGTDHVWAKNPSVTTVTKEEIEQFFILRGFSICEIEEKREIVKTVFDDEQFFHTIEVIAKKVE